MYTKSMRQGALCAYHELKTIKSKFLRFQFGLDYNRPRIATQFPGTKHMELLQQADSAQQFDQSVSSQHFQVVLTFALSIGS